MKKSRSAARKERASPYLRVKKEEPSVDLSAFSSAYASSLESTATASPLASAALTASASSTTTSSDASLSSSSSSSYLASSTVPHDDDEPMAIDINSVMAAAAAAAALNANEQKEKEKKRAVKTRKKEDKPVKTLDQLSLREYYLFHQYRRILDNDPDLAEVLYQIDVHRKPISNRGAEHLVTNYSRKYSLRVDEDGKETPDAEFFIADEYHKHLPKTDSDPCCRGDLIEYIFPNGRILKTTIPQLGSNISICQSPTICYAQHNFKIIRKDLNIEKRLKPKKQTPEIILPEMKPKPSHIFILNPLPRPVVATPSATPSDAASAVTNTVVVATTATTATTETEPSSSSSSTASSSSSSPTSTSSSLSASSSSSAPLFQLFGSMMSATAATAGGVNVKTNDADAPTPSLHVDTSTPTPTPSPCTPLMACGLGRQ